MINKVILLGNVGKDPEVRHLEGGGVVANFTLATSERFRDKSGLLQERTEWHNVVCWGPSADRAEKYVRKGTQLYVEGKIRTRSYDAKDGSKRYVTEIYVDVMQLLGKKGDAPGVPAAAPAQGVYNPQPQQQSYSAPAAPSAPQYSAPAAPSAPQYSAPAAPSFDPATDMGGTETDDLPF